MGPLEAFQPHARDLLLVVQVPTSWLLALRKLLHPQMLRNQTGSPTLPVPRLCRFIGITDAGTIPTDQQPFTPCMGYLNWLLQTVKSQSTGKERNKSEVFNFSVFCCCYKPHRNHRVWMGLGARSAQSTKSQVFTPQLVPRKQLCLHSLWLSQNHHHQHGIKAEGSASALSSQVPA